MKNLIIELYVPADKELDFVLAQLERTRLVELDRDFSPVPIRRRGTREEADAPATFAVRGQVADENVARLAELAFVHAVWNDTPIDHFARCNSGRRGTLDRVAECIGAKQLWGRGHRGDGVVIGIVDGGVDRNKIPAVINGSRPDWGTVVDWNEHGNMTATDALGVAPAARIYDLRIAGSKTPATLSNALQAYQWAIQQHEADGTPHVLSNSWGIYEESWDPSYATNPNHPFTLKVQEALDRGIKVLFSAGNCGDSCPDGRCRNDHGGGRDIWGANGHEEVMCVGAVKLNNRRLRYSSQGPAALHASKPDFCGYSSFKGYFRTDSGTSAACPVVAGAVAVLLSYDPALTQPQLKDLLQRTAKDVQGYGFDHDTGHGVVRLDAAYYDLEPGHRPARDFRDRLCERVYHAERKCVKEEVEAYKSCAQTRDDGYLDCSQTRDDGYNACTETRDEGYNSCCTWWPCSWGCKALVWIANVVCVAWTWVKNLVCVAWTWIKNVVCVLWTWTVARVCKLWVWVLPRVTLTNCACR